MERGTFMKKVKFDWREESQGGSTVHHAKCRICPSWQANDTSRSGLHQSTANHKIEHFLAATGDQPTPLPEYS